jgi:hypothetical protein
MMEMMLHNDAAKVEMELLERNAAKVWRFSQFKGWEHQILSHIWSAVREAVRKIFRDTPAGGVVPSAAERRAEA